MGGKITSVRLSESTLLALEDLGPRLGVLGEVSALVGDSPSQSMLIRLALSIGLKELDRRVTLVERASGR